MHRKMFLSLFLALASIGMFTSAARAEDPLARFCKKMNLSLDVTYVSKYMGLSGTDIYDDHGAVQPEVTFSIPDTNFYANVWASYPIGGGYENATEYDYTFGYKFKVFDGTASQMDMNVNYSYYDYIDEPSTLDEYRINLKVKMPNLLQIGEKPLVPYYRLAYNAPVHGTHGDAGFYHVFGLFHYVDVPWFCPDETKEFEFYVKATYNDGVSNRDHDWSHLRFGTKTNFKLGDFTLTPFVNYQVSMDETCNGGKDELWAGATLSYCF